jgi:hypothetical protein
VEVSFGIEFPPLVEELLQRLFGVSLLQERASVVILEAFD